MQPIPGRQHVGGKARLARHAVRIPKAAIVERKDFGTQTRCGCLVVLDARAQHALEAVAVKKEHSRVCAERSADVHVDVDWSGQGGVCGGGGEEGCSVRGIERIGGDEPGTERLVVGLVDAQIVRLNWSHARMR